MEIFTKICYALTIVFLVSGMLFLAVVLHEVSHKHDMQVLEGEHGEIVFFPSNQENSSFFTKAMASYQTTYAPTDENIAKEKEIEKYTEYKAYFITFIILLTFLYALDGVITHYARRLHEAKQGDV